MKKLILVLAVATAVTGTCFAFNTNAGTSTAQFLKLGAGARASGMGEAFAAVTDDASAIYWNPAGLSRLDQRSVSLMHAVWLDDISYEWASYAQPMGSGVVGAGVQYLSYGSLAKMDDTGLEGDTFAPTDMAALLSYARTIGGVGVGLNIKFISTKIVHTATAYAADLGVQRRLGDKLTLGLAMQNMGTAMKFENEEDPLPANLKVGGAYAIQRNWLAALDINAANDDYVLFGAGTEYVRMIDDALQVAGRLGYTTATDDTSGANGLTAGVGCTYEGYTIDYAYVPYGDLGNTHRISLSVKF